MIIGKTGWRILFLFPFFLVGACDWVDRGVGGNIPPRVYDDGPYIVPEGGKLDVGADIGPLANDEDGGNRGLTAILVEPPKHAAPGGFELHPDGSFTYVHDGSEHYEDYFVYIANDGLDDSEEQKNVLIKITPVNDPPVITGQETVTVAEDGAITPGPQLLKISDPDNLFPDDFQVEVLAAGDNYSVENNTIKPAKDFNGTIRVPVIVNDGSDDSEPFELLITVTPVNDPPVITGWNPALLTTEEDVALPITLDALETFDVEGDSVMLQVLPGNGYVTAGNTITPAPDWFGELTVNVRVSDAQDFTSGQIPVVVEPVNDAPRVAQDEAVGKEDEALLIDVVQNDADPEGNQEIDRNSLRITSAPEHGQATVEDGKVRYVPDPDFHGSDGFGYTVADIHGATSREGRVLVQITPVNDAPIAVDDWAKTKEDTTKRIDVSKNDTDPDGNNDIDRSSITIVTQPAHGKVISRQNGTVEYTPNENYYGKDKFTYRISDFSGVSSNIATVGIVIEPVNDPPFADDDSAVTDEDQAVTIRVTDGDRDEDGRIDRNSVSIVDPPSHGRAVVSTRGRVTYTPAPDYHGTDQFTYTVRDDEGAVSNKARVTITVRSVNDPPRIVGQKPLSVQEDGSLRITLKDLLVEDPDNQYPEGFSLSLRSGANYSVSGTTVIPRKDFAGVLKIPVTVNDGLAESNVFTLSVTVVAVNDPPAISGTPPTQVKEGERYRFVPSVSDRDANERFTFHIQNKPVWAGFDPATGGLEGVPGNKDVGVTRGIIISVRDSAGAEAALSPFDITVINVNDAPVITGQKPDPLTTPEETPLTITLGHLEVSDPDNDYPNGFGLRVLDGDNYSRSGNTITPAPDFTGMLTVPVRVNDGQADSKIFNLKVSVTPVNDAPQANDDSVSTAQDESVDIDVLANDGDPDGDSLTIQSVDNLSKEGGTVAIASGNRVVYTPPANFTGEDQFYYMVSDGNGGTARAKVTVTVTAPLSAAALNLPPTTSGDCSMIPAGGSVRGRLSAVDPDGEQKALRFYLEKQAAKGTVWLSVDGRFTYQPYADARGVDGFSYRVVDQQGLKGNGKVKIIVGKTRIMPLGDGVTAGYGDGATRHGYRAALRRSLIQDGYAVEFVGSQSDVPDRHEGHSGAEVTTAYVAARIADWLAANPADVILLYLGSQDFVNGGDAAVSDARIVDILTTVKTVSPGTTILLAEIVDGNPPNPAIRRFNELIRSKDGQPGVLVVDLDEALDSEHDLKDGFMPSAEGYDKMASAWHEALQTVLEKCP